jgi:hypothetical protein
MSQETMQPARRLELMERATATGEGGVARTDPGIGSPLDRVAFSATLHCLAGCAIGEVTGMAIAMALGWGNLASIALAVGLAYVFGSASPRCR